ncbi:MAG: hypothetical protein ABI488_00460 [Polyangiaceae bacterium]
MPFDEVANAELVDKYARDKSRLLETPEGKASLDKDVAVAKGDSMTVFGMTLGKPLELPYCAHQLSNQSDADYKAALAKQGNCIDVFRSDKRPEPSADPRRGRIRLSNSPSWMPSSWVWVTEIGGRVVAVDVQGYGAERQQQVVEGLAKKYGNKPLVASEPTVCSNSLTGVELSRANDRAWNLSGVHVYLTFSCVLSDISIQTETFHQRGVQAEAASHAREQQL